MGITYNQNLPNSSKQKRRDNMTKYPNIEAERARAGISKEGLAKILGISISTLKNWQSGKTEIPANKIITIAKLFNVSTDYLLGRPVDE
jgi:transcriptional regulator with XRE-family HTH domain